MLLYTPTIPLPCHQMGAVISANLINMSLSMAEDVSYAELAANQTHPKQKWYSIETIRWGRQMPGCRTVWFLRDNDCKASPPQAWLDLLNKDETIDAVAKPDERFKDLCRWSTVKFLLFVVKSLCKGSTLHCLLTQHCYVQRKRPLAT